MSRQVEVAVPHHSARNVLDLLDASTLVNTLTHFTTQEAIRISFKVRPKHLQAVIDQLTGIGCGETYGTIDVYPLIMSRPVVDREKRVKRSYAISDRMTIDEIQVTSNDLFKDLNSHRKSSKMETISLSISWLLSQWLR